jgi:hypothetical protein
MPKASLKLANGTIVDIEGTVEEVHKLLSFYDSSTPKSQPKTTPRAKSSTDDRPRQSADENSTGSDVDLVAIVNAVKSCDEAELIEKSILDQTDQLNRVLLPMYVVYEQMSNVHGLTSGHISKVTTQLSVPVKQPNVSKTLSGSAAKYVIGDSVRKRGEAVRYKLSRRGHSYLKQVITNNGKSKDKMTS